jgi:hypothetical protein
LYAVTNTKYHTGCESFFFIQQSRASRFISTSTIWRNGLGRNSHNRSAQVIYFQSLDRQDGNAEFRPKVTVAFEGSWVK